MKILLSIKPEYTEKIFSGKKKYEFRKQKPKQIIEKVIIYETRPSKNIVGWFTVKRILSDSPEKIWEMCKSLSGIEKEEYFAYCNGRRIIHAFEINKISRFDTPIDPFGIFSNFNPPQNFSYLDNSPISNAIEKWEDDCK